MYYDANGNKLWGQRAYVVYKREKGELGTTGGGVKKRSGGGGRKRKAGGRKAGGRGKRGKKSIYDG